MSPHEFSKTMKNPYFQSKYYREESAMGKKEQKIGLFFYKLKIKILFWKKDKNVKF